MILLVTNILYIRFFKLYFENFQGYCKQLTKLGIIINREIIIDRNTLQRLLCCKTDYYFLWKFPSLSRSLLGSFVPLNNLTESVNHHNYLTHSWNLILINLARISLRKKTLHETDKFLETHGFNWDNKTAYLRQEIQAVLFYVMHIVPVKIFNFKVTPLSCKL